MKDIFLALQKRLTNKIPALQAVDWYLNQYGQHGEYFQIATPAAYIQFAPMTTETLGYNVQAVDMTIYIHLVSEALYDDSNRVTDSAIDHATLITSVYQALQRWEAWLSDVPGNEALKGTSDDRLIINAINRTEILPDHRMENLMATVQKFTTMAIDYSAMEVKQEIVANLQAGKYI